MAIHRERKEQKNRNSADYNEQNLRAYGRDALTYGTGATGGSSESSMSVAKESSPQRKRAAEKG